MAKKDDPYRGQRNSAGHFQKGNKGSPGRPKLPDLFARTLRAAGEQKPTPLHYKMVARGLGLDLDNEDEQVPKFKTIRELMCWQIQMSAVAGDAKTQASLLDREAPKPVRAKDESDGAKGRVPTGALGVSPEAAGWIERLRAP